MNSIDSFGLLLGTVLSSLALGVTLAWLFLKGLLNWSLQIPASRVEAGAKLYRAQKPDSRNRS
jgi:hypothetical protein